MHSAQAINPNIERRQHKRAQFKETLMVHPVFESKSGNVYEVGMDPLTVKSMDVSEGGLRLELSAPPPPSKIFKVNLQLPKNHKVDLYTQIAWTRGLFCGLKFIVLDGTARQFIRNHVDKAAS